MSNTKTREELLNEARRVRDQINELDQLEFKNKVIPNHKALIGKAFVYRRNSYSCPSKPSDYWDVFRRVLDVEVDKKEAILYLLYEEVQIDSHGAACIKTDRDLVTGLKENFGAGWVPCKLAEYQSNRRKVLLEMERLTEHAGGNSGLERNK